jgi:hypothetical protein
MIDDDERPRLGDMTIPELARFCGISTGEMVERLMSLADGAWPPTEDEIWRAVTEGHTH